MYLYIYFGFCFDKSDKSVVRTTCKTDLQMTSQTKLKNDKNDISGKSDFEKEPQND